MKVAEPYAFNGYEIEELVPPPSKTFETSFITTEKLRLIQITKEMRKYMIKMQMKYCKQETPINDYIFKKTLLFLTPENTHTLPPLDR